MAVLRVEERFDVNSPIAGGDKVVEARHRWRRKQGSDVVVAAKRLRQPDQALERDLPRRLEPPQRGQRNAGACSKPGLGQIGIKPNRPKPGRHPVSKLLDRLKHADVLAVIGRFCTLLLLFGQLLELQC
jgi:hypothetical protein